jgi:hypothetical protein
LSVETEALSLEEYDGLFDKSFADNKFIVINFTPKKKLLSAILVLAGQSTNEQRI